MSITALRMPDPPGEPHEHHLELAETEETVEVDTPPDAAELGESSGPPLLPDQFWTARPDLNHIRSAARARRLAPDAVLGAVLARFAASVDWRIRLPNIVGRQGSLNLSVALIGPSGAGKGSSLDEAASLLRDLRQACDHKTGEASVGSGEGFIKAFFDQVPDESSERKSPPLVWSQVRRGMLFRVDEGEILAQLAQRSGSTLDPILRSAWSGEALGGSYVGESGQRRLPAHSYRAAIIMGLQPKVCRFLLDQEAGGTPQRMLWLPAAFDPGAPDRRPDHPGPLHLIEVPTFADMDDRAVVDHTGIRCVEMRPGSRIIDQIETHHRDLLRGKVQVDALDTHRYLGMLKVAGLLALLDGRIDITTEDWTLAAIVDDTSRAVRSWVQVQLRQVERARDNAAADRAGQRAEAAAIGDAAGRGVAVRLGRSIARHTVRAAEKNESATRGSLRRQLASADRRSFEAGLTYAIERNWVAEMDGFIIPGDSLPA